jgi:hypothetical protein
MRRGAAAPLALVVLAGCFGSGQEKPATKSPPVAATPASRSITAGCEDLGPHPDWRRGAVDVGDFGLLAQDLRNAQKKRNGNYVAKMGAVVAGHTPISLRVPKVERGRVGLIYGDATRGTGARLSRAPVEIRFEPCSNRARSGYVGGLLLNVVTHPVTLKVQALGSRIETLTVPPAPRGAA